MTKLNNKQKLFCYYYCNNFNATKAYQQAFNCSYNAANSNFPRLMAKDGIKQEIARLNKERFENIMLDESSVIQQYLDIAFANIKDFVDFGTDEYGNNYIKILDYEKLDGKVIQELNIDSNSVKIKLYDKFKALQWLSDRMDLLKKETEINIENDKAKLELQALKIELDMRKNMPEEEVVDDGFIQALKDSVEETWND